MNFLQLCQKVAFESGTIPASNGTNLPAAVTGQTGRLAKIVEWVKDSWEDIQAERSDWDFMRSPFTSTDIVQSTAKYSAADLSITDWREWIMTREAHRDSNFTIYLTATGVADEAPLFFKDWPSFQILLRGPQTENRPQHITIDPDGELRLHPTPDAAYTLRGRYLRVPQVFSAPDDEPTNLASYHHRLIVWWALSKYLAVDEEAATQIGSWNKHRTDMMDRLVREQTPRMTFAEGFG